MTNDLINLKERFGSRYKIAWSEEVKDEARQPMNQIIPAKRGHFYPFSDSEVGFFCESHRLATNLLKEFPEDVRVFVDAEDAVELLIKADAFEKVADRDGARKKRRVSERERQRLSEMGKNTRFFAAINAASGF